MLSLRPLRRPRRPSNTWMEVDLPLKCTLLFLIQKLLTDSMRECDGNSHFLLYDSIGSTWVLLFCFSLWFFTPFLEIRWLFTDSWFSAVRDPESNKNYSAMMVLLTFVTICVFPLLIFFLNKLISFYCRIIFNILWFLFCSQVRLMGRRSLLQLFLPSVFALPLVDFLRPVECLRHRLCGAEAPRAWGEGMLIKGCVLFKVFLLSQAVWTLHHEYFHIFVWQVSISAEAVPSTAPFPLQITRSQASSLSFQLQLLQIDQSFLLRQFFCFNPVSDSLQFMISIPSGLRHRHLGCSQHENKSACRVSFIFYFCCKSELLQILCGGLTLKQQLVFVIFTPSLGSTEVNFFF